MDNTNTITGQINSVNSILSDITANIRRETKTTETNTITAPEARTEATA